MLESIEMQELRQNFSTKDITGASRRNSETIFILLGITPHQVAKGAIVRYLLKPIHSFNLINRLDERRQTSMDGEYFAIYVGGNREIIKNIGEIFPYNSISVLGLALHIKTVVLGDCSGFVISSDHIHPIGILDLEEAEQGDHFHTVCPSVHIIPQKQIASVGQFSSNLECFDQVIELPMDISHQCYRCWDFINVFFLHEDVLQSMAYHTYCLLFQHFAFQGPFDQLINVKGHTLVNLNFYQRNLGKLIIKMSSRRLTQFSPPDFPQEEADDQLLLSFPIQYPSELQVEIQSYSNDEPDEVLFSRVFFKLQLLFKHLMNSVRTKKELFLILKRIYEINCAKEGQEEKVKNLNKKIMKVKTIKQLLTLEELRKVCGEILFECLLGRI